MILCFIFFLCLRQPPKLPTRRAVAMEVTAFMNKRSGRCRWQRTNIVISEVFEGTKKYKDMEVAVEGVTVKWPTMVGPEGGPQTGERRRPTKCRTAVSVERPKYGKLGGFETRMVRRLSLPRELERLAVDMCNASLARNTWRSYSSAERAAMKCEDDTGVNMSPPWGEAQAVTFATYCINRNLAASTIRQYLSGIKACHSRMGFKLEAYDSFILRAVMKGRGNTEGARKQKVPMSPGLMMMLREKIKLSRMAPADKTMVWAVAVCLYAGSLRGGEMLGDVEGQYDPKNIMMTEDIAIKKVRCGDGTWRKMVSARVKNPKELKGLTTIEVEMFQNGGFMCPVRAVERALKYSRAGRPFATLSSGGVMTKGGLNKMLRRVFEGTVDYEINTISSHSFRSGLATAMARQGYSDEEIQRQGRWKSAAFLSYLKLGRSTRLAQQQKLAEDMDKIARSEIEENVAMRGIMRTRG